MFGRKKNRKHGVYDVREFPRKPYAEVRENAVFIQDPALADKRSDPLRCKYYRFPSEKKVVFTEHPGQAVNDQMFFVDAVNDFGRELNSITSATNTVTDTRRTIEVLTVRDTTKGISTADPRFTDRQRDYLSRVNGGKARTAKWNTFLGVNLRIRSESPADQSLASYRDDFIDAHLQPDAVRDRLYDEDIANVDKIAVDHGLSPINFADDRDREAFHAITAWHGIRDESILLERRLEDQMYGEASHSLLLPKWQQCMVVNVAIEDSENRYVLVDPADPNALWAREVFNPDCYVVAAKFTGQIRSNTVTKTVLANREELSDQAVRQLDETAKRSEVSEKVTKTNVLSRMREMANRGHCLISYASLQLVVRVIPHRKNLIQQYLASYGVRAAPAIGKQGQSFNSFFPCYPNKRLPTIARTTDVTRGVNEHEMFPGWLAMSGLFSNVRGTGRFGIFLGMTNFLYEFVPIFTEVEAAGGQSGGQSGFLITGRTGAGKTQMMIQMALQAANLSYVTWYLNPKPRTSLYPVWKQIDGTHLAINRETQRGNAGIMDPMGVLTNREHAASVLSTYIYEAWTHDNQEARKTSSAALDASILHNAMDRRARTSADVIFGSKHIREMAHELETKMRRPRVNNVVYTQDQIASAVGDLCRKNDGIPPIPQYDVRRFVAHKMQTTAFWTGLVSDDHRTVGQMIRDVRQRRAVLVEWQDIDIPEPGAELTAPQLETIQSVSLMLNYAMDCIADAGAGIVFVDESHVLQHSKRLMAQIDLIMRTMREMSATIVFADQDLGNWFDIDTDGNYTSKSAMRFDRIAIGAIGAKAKREQDIFVQVAHMQHNQEQALRIIKNAGIYKENAEGEVDTETIVRPYPTFWYIDDMKRFNGPIIAGPYPERELFYGRTDREAKRMRAAMSKSRMDMTSDDAETDSDPFGFDEFGLGSDYGIRAPFDAAV